MIVDNETGRELRQWRGGPVKSLLWQSKTFDRGTKTFYSRLLVRGDFSEKEITTPLLVPETINLDSGVEWDDGIELGDHWVWSTEVTQFGTSAVITLNIDGIDKSFTVTKSGMVNIGRIRANTIIVKVSGTATIKRIIIGSSAREVLNV